jgi:hypothetical protein
MRYLKFTFLATILGLSAAMLWHVFDLPLPDFRRSSEPAKEGIPAANAHVDPVLKSKFDRITVGMTLPEVEQIVGPAGLSYSSQIERQYYIWKSKNGWIRVWVEEGAVTAKRFNPELSNDDD